MPPVAKPVPDGYHSIAPYLSIDGASDAIAFYAWAFGAEEIYRLAMPGGKIGHAEMRIGDSRIMLADEFQDMPEAVAKSPRTVGATTVTLTFYLPDVDAGFRRAIEAGAKVLRPIENQFYGDRCGTLQDPFGHVWTLMTRIEDVEPEEMMKRMQAMFPV